LLSCRIEHVRVEKVTDFLVIVFERLEDEKRGDDEKDLGVTLLEEVREGLVLLCCGLNHLAEVEQLVTLLGVEEIGETLRPSILVLNQDLN
jgi:hypothetical protein